MPGPDFPTGGILVEQHETIEEAYRTGRGSLRLRARWNVETMKGGIWQIVIVEIPYQVPKSRLIEKIAELMQEKKLPILEDIRDESTSDVRLVLEPRSRIVDPEALMENLFRLTELESRVSLNMNVLDANGMPRVMGLPELLRAWLDHRRVVLQRIGRHRLARIEHRREVLDGLLIAYLNIDAIIKLIRQEDEPKPKMMKRWSLTDIQAEAILNMRLRALRKLEEIEIRTEHKALQGRKHDLNALLKSEDRQWETISGEIAEGGVFIATYNTLSVGSGVTLAITLPGGFEFKVPGRVHFVRDPMDLMADSEPGMGVRFEGLNGDNRELVLRFVRKRAPMFYDD